MTRPAATAGTDSPGNARLTASQRKAIAALLSERSIAGAARVVRVNEGTIRRWMRESDAFREAYELAVEETVDEALSVLRSATTRAAEVIVELAEKAESETVRLAAARAVVDRVMDRDLEKLEERIAALEGKGRGDSR